MKKNGLCDMQILPTDICENNSSKKGKMKITRARTPPRQNYQS